MYARVTTAEGTSEDFNRGIAYVQDRVLPAMRDAPGFRGMVHLKSRDGKKTLGITLWESEEALRASGEVARQMREGADREGLPGTRSAEEFEVIFDERP